MFIVTVRLDALYMMDCTCDALIHLTQHESIELDMNLIADRSKPQVFLVSSRFLSAFRRKLNKAFTSLICSVFAVKSLLQFLFALFLWNQTQAWMEVEKDVKKIDNAGKGF